MDLNPPERFQSVQLTENFVAAGWIYRHLSRAMRRWTSRQVLALLLGVVLALPMGLSAAQASMSKDLAGNSSCADALGDSGRDCCGTDNGDYDADACLSLCVNNACGVFPGGCEFSNPDRSSLLIQAQIVVPGHALPPEPSPPRRT